jgi:virginiamycin B lyase
LLQLTRLAAAFLACIAALPAAVQAAAMITEYDGPGGPSDAGSTTSMPLQAAVDSQSNLWFGQFTKGNVVRFDGVNHTEFDIAPATGPMNIWVDSADGIWLSAVGDYLVNIKADGEVVHHALPGINSMPMGVSGDSKGNIWVARMWTNKLARLAPDGTITEYRIPTFASEPAGLTVDQYDNVWYAGMRSGKIGVLRAATGKFNEYKLPFGARPMSVSYQPKQKTQNVIWFTEEGTNKIGSITQTGQITRYAIPTPGSGPMMAAEDAAGNVWFAEFAASKIGRLRADRTFSEYPTPTPRSEPMGIAVDFNDGSVWFAETRPNKVGHLVPND